LQFAAAIRSFVEAKRTTVDNRKSSDTRRLYDRLFSAAAYQNALAALAAPLLESEAGVAIR
jgi:hypothetical protein